MWKQKSKTPLTTDDVNFYLGGKSQKREPPVPIGYVNKQRELIKLCPESFEDIFHVGYRNHLQFSSRDILQWAKLKSSQRLENSKISKMNKWICALFREEFEKGVRPPLHIRWVDPFLGYGVFASEQIPALTYVGEYAGVVRKRSRRKDRANDYVFGYVVGPKESRFVIDAREFGNHTRYINHSDEPNLNSRWVIIDGLCHIVFFTNRLIKKGEQLSYDYGPYYWRKRASPILC